MVIQKRFHEFCDSCPYLDVDVSSFNLMADNRIIEHEVVLSCRMEHQCARIRTYLEEKKNAEET